MEKSMKIFFLISALIMAPLSFASYHGENNTPTNNNSDGYGGSNGLAIAGVLALVGGLAYYFTRDPKETDETENELLSKSSTNTKKFEINFNNKINESFDSFSSNGLKLPQNHFQINFDYKLQ